MILASRERHRRWPRRVSLALCLLAGLLPAVTPQADAVISTVIGTSLKMCTSLVKGGIYACRNGSEYDNAGQGVLAVFKYAGSDLLGIDFGGSSSGQTKETVIQKVDLSKVEAELSSISKQLEKNSAYGFCPASAAPAHTQHAR